MPTGVRGDWKLTFDDEFDGTSLDTARWSTGWYGSGITPPVNLGKRTATTPLRSPKAAGRLT